MRQLGVDVVETDQCMFGLMTWVVKIPADVGQETHDIHDQLQVRGERAEEEVRRIPPTPAIDRWPCQGCGKIPACAMPSNMPGYHEGEDAEADGPQGSNGSR